MINQTQIIVGTNIIYSTEVFKSYLFDYNDAYILVKGDITIVRNSGAQIAFKNCAPFT